MTRALWIEATLVSLAAAVAVALVPLTAGEWGWSWDALNHHIYLGLFAESPRWHLDVVAASTQSYQYPYLYWPVYRLSLLDIGGARAGAIWSAALALLVVPPVWFAAWRLLPPEGLRTQAIFERTAACALALSSVVVLSAFNTTANDLLGSVPLLWAVALMTVERPGDARAGWAAALWGASAAFKLSNALAIPLLLVWWWQRPGWPLHPRRGLIIGIAATLGYALIWAPWGWQLWLHTGNPFYPFFGHLFRA
jgi:hypothetical protein